MRIFLFYLLLILPNFSEVLIGSFTTSIEMQNSDVKKNLYLAAEKLNNITIEPNTVFSFSDIVGEASIANGYSLGKIYYWNESIYEAGGGLCQASSTLFNLFLQVGFIIKERYKHSQTVSYVPLGLDATIYYGKKNLKMLNPHKQRFLLKSEINETRLTFFLFGEYSLNETYTIETEEEEHELPILKNKKVFKNPITISVYRNKFIKEEFIEKQFLYKDYIPAVYFDNK